MKKYSRIGKNIKQMSVHFFYKIYCTITSRTFITTKINNLYLNSRKDKNFKSFNYFVVMSSVVVYTAHNI